LTCLVIEDDEDPFADMTDPVRALIVRMLTRCTVS
jgi:hypothetical protein